MKYQNSLKCLSKLVIIIGIILSLTLASLAQQRRFGIDKAPSKTTPKKEQTRLKESKNQKETPRRYLPTETNRRFGLQPGESEPEMAPLVTTLERPKSLVKMAEQFAAKGQMEKAITNYQKAIDKKESLALAYFGLGNVLMKLSKTDEAITAFNQAIKINPNNFKVYLNLGVILHSTGKLDEAISYYKQATSISKGQFADAEFNLALAFFHQGDFPNSIEHYQKAIQIRKTYPAAYNNLGLVYEALGNFETAINNFQLAIKQNQGNYPLAHYNLGRFYFNQGNFFPEAVNELEIALKNQNNFPEALLMLGNIYLIYETRTGNIDTVIKAKSFYEKAIISKPNYPLAYENLAIAYSRLGKKTEAFAEYRKAFNLSNKYSPFLVENLIGTINSNSSFFINDEFSRPELPINIKQKNPKAETDKEAILALLKNYEELPDESKNLTDIRYCFGKIYVFVGNWALAVNEFSQALELSDGNDKETLDLLKSIPKTAN